MWSDAPVPKVPNVWARVSGRLRAAGLAAGFLAGDARAVAVFDRAADGRLVQKAGTAGCVKQFGDGVTCAAGRGLFMPDGPAVSRDGASVYVAGLASQTVAIFDRAPTGRLAQKPGTAGCVSESGSSGECVDGAALVAATGVPVSPDGASVYVAALNSNSVAIFDRGPPRPPGTPPPGDTTRPVLSALTLSPPRLRAEARGASIAAAGRSRVSYRLPEAAAVRFTVQTAASGRRVGGRCVRATRANRRAKPCTRYVPLGGGFTHVGSPGATASGSPVACAAAGLPPPAIASERSRPTRPATRDAQAPDVPDRRAAGEAMSSASR